MVETASLGSGSTGSGGGGGVGDAAGGGDAGSGGGGIPSGLPFQVGYREAGQEYTLYLLAAREQDRAEWIRAIRAGKPPFFYSLFIPFSSFFFRLSRIDIQCGLYVNIGRDKSFLRQARIMYFILITFPIYLDILLCICWTH